MVHVTLADVSSAFDPLSPVSFNLDRMETNPRFATITQTGNACVLARLRLDMGERGGRMEILIPYATLEPIRALLLQQFMGEKLVVTPFGKPPDARVIQNRCSVAGRSG